MLNQIKKFIADEQGLTIVEYAVAGGLITIAVVAGFKALGTAVSGNISGLTSAVSAR